MMPLLAEMVREHPSAAAVVDARGTTSWEQLDRRVGALVSGLRERGLVEGDRVVAMLGNQVELVEVSLACMHAGWLLVPLNWHWVADEVAYVLADADASAVVVDERFHGVVAAAMDAGEAPEVGIALLVGSVVGDHDDVFEPYGSAAGGSPGRSWPTCRGRPDVLHVGDHRPPQGRASGLSAQLGRITGDLDPDGALDADRDRVAGRRRGAGDLRSDVPLGAVGHVDVRAAVRGDPGAPAPLRRG